MGAEMIVRIAALVLLALLFADRNLFGQQAPAAADQPASAGKALDGRQDDLVEREMLVARWYLGRHDYTGALNRLKIVVVHHRASRHVEEALAHLTQAYLTLGIAREAQIAAGVLGRNFPNGDWYAKARDLLKSAGLEPYADENSWMAPAFK
jgi:outer membrane protein assembly factor BamD